MSYHEEPHSSLRPVPGGSGRSGRDLPNEASQSSPLREFLKQPRNARRCSICQNKELADEVRDYVSGRKDGSISHSIHYIWDRYFGPRWKMGSDNTLRNHIRHHLGEDL